MASSCNCRQQNRIVAETLVLLELLRLSSYCRFVQHDDAAALARRLDDDDDDDSGVVWWHQEEEEEEEELACLVYLLMKIKNTTTNY